MSKEPSEKDEFLAKASEKQSNLASELLGLLKSTRKWWLAPVVISILILGLLVILGGTAAAPFIYTLF